MDKKYLQKCLEKWYANHEALMDAYFALVKGGVKSYMLDDRQLTKLDITSLKKEIEDAEAKINELEADLAGKKPRKAYAIFPHEW